VAASRKSYTPLPNAEYQKGKPHEYFNMLATILQGVLQKPSRKDGFMKSLLEEFAQGNILPEPRFFKRDSHYGRTMEILSMSEEKLLMELDGELKENLKQFSEAQAEISLLSGIDRFIYGYRLGVLMTMEVFNGKDDLVLGGEDSE
jgi:hypothetical protein